MLHFQNGVSGNPKGKKLGTLNKRTELAKRFETHAESLIDKVVELALSGDTVAYSGSDSLCAINCNLSTLIFAKVNAQEYGCCALPSQ